MTRHSRSDPCPVCGGAKQDKQGTGQRCWGRSDEDWTFCTRPEHAGGIPLHENTSTYAHKMQGHCNCGVEHAPSNGNGHHHNPNRKKLRTYVYELIDASGQRQAKHIRTDYDDGTKGFFFDPLGVKTESLPLYGVPDLLKLPKGVEVILTEGEKKCDSLKEVGINAVATGCGSSVTPYKKSLEVLSGYKVYLWPDNDDPGRSHMEKVAVSLRELKIKPLFIKWDEAPKKGDAADYLEAGGTADGIRQLMKDAALYDGTTWEEPIPIDTASHPEFPVGAVPEWLGKWVSGISEEMQTPPDLAAMLALSVLASTVAKKYRVNIRANWEEPLNVMVAVALPPGERKSAVFAEAIKPIITYEHEHAKDWRVAYQIQKISYELAEKRLQSLMKVEQPNMSELNQAAADFAVLKKPVMPRLYTDDVTVEKLASMLADQNGRMALFSAEGGIFTTLAGRYSEGMPSLDIVLKSHGGDSIRVDRVGRESNLINAPALTLGLSVQPGVLASLGEKKEFLSHGLIARFLYSTPKSKVGNRKIAQGAMDRAVKDRYALGVRLLLSRPDTFDEYGEIQPQIIRFSEEAAALFVAYETQIEGRLKLDGDLCMLGGWGSKLLGATARIAGILHLAEFSTLPEGEKIPAIGMEQILKAQDIGDYLIEHVKSAFGIIGNYAAVEAKRIAKWLTEKKVTTFSRREAYRAMNGHMNLPAEIDAPLRMLEEFGYIKEIEQPQKARKGRPPSAKFNVHPGLF